MKAVADPPFAVGTKVRYVGISDPAHIANLRRLGIALRGDPPYRLNTDIPANSVQVIVLARRGCSGYDIMGARGQFCSRWITASEASQWEVVGVVPEHERVAVVETERRITVDGDPTEDFPQEREAWRART